MRNARGWARKSIDPDDGAVRIAGMSPIIVWFRQDLRLSDNPALLHAVASGKSIICLYVLDDETPGAWKMGGASRWWLHHSLAALDKDLRTRGGNLVLRRGPAAKIVPALLRETGADAITWNRCYEPFAVQRDTALKTALIEKTIAVESCKGSLLTEPWEIKTGAGTSFRVYTPFWKAARARLHPGQPRPKPETIRFHAGAKSDSLKSWKLLPAKPDWAKGFGWTPGEEAARERLTDFLDQIAGYGTGRDIPGIDASSRLSPHLHFGEISPRQVWQAICANSKTAGAEKFLGEIGWREFNHQLLFHHPRCPTSPTTRVSPE
jgi:deoxyribodipyrimidine photo-lyase